MQGKIIFVVATRAGIPVSQASSVTCFSFTVCCSFVPSANRSSMERKKSEEMVVLIHICSFMFTVITVLSNLCYMLFSSEPNEVHTNGNDPDEE